MPPKSGIRMWYGMIRISAPCKACAYGTFWYAWFQACRDCKNIHKTEVIVSTHREFDIAEWKPKMIPRLDDYW